MSNEITSNCGSESNTVAQWPPDQETIERNRLNRESDAEVEARLEAVYFSEEMPKGWLPAFHRWAMRWAGWIVPITAGIYAGLALKRHWP